MQLLSLIPILILLLHLLVSIGLVYTGFRELVLGFYPKENNCIQYLQISVNVSDGN